MKIDIFDDVDQEVEIIKAENLHNRVKELFYFFMFITKIKPIQALF